MKMKMHSLSVILCALLLSVDVTSIAIAGGPIFSRFGVGDLLRYGGSRIDAMGGAGISLIGDGFLNRLNPAGIAQISFTRFSGGFEYSNYSSTDASGSGTYARGAFKGLGIAFPISRDHGVAMMIEASPYSAVNYATQTTDSLLQQDFYGTGGLWMISVGATYAPTLIIGRPPVDDQRWRYLCAGEEIVIGFEDESRLWSNPTSGQFHIFRSLIPQQRDTSFRLLRRIYIHDRRHF